MIGMERVVGIDYGSKLAGTTAVAYFRNDMVRFKSSKHQEDADKFISELLLVLKPELVFLDAPLSLPGKYVDREQYDDYFYRAADKELGAMSPMFLGGLTARAMKLRDYLEKAGMKVFETYPSYKAKLLELPKDKYKKDEKHILELAQSVAEKFEININFDQIENWHYFDALLAFVAGVRYVKNNHQIFGNEKEGLIVV